MKYEKIDNNMDAKLDDFFKSWAQNGSIPTEKSRQLENMVIRLARKEKRKRFGWTAGSIITVLMVFSLVIFSSPAVSTWAADNIPVIGVIGQYISKWSTIEKGWEWAEENEMYQEVLASCTDKGYTIRIHRVLTDPTQTTIFYTVEGEKPGDIYDIEKVTFNGERFDYGLAGRGDMINGVYAGSIEFDRAMPQDKGRLELAVRQIADKEGKWNLSFPISQEPLKKLTRTVEINKEIELPAGELMLTEVVVAPSQTVVRLSYTDNNYNGQGGGLRFVDCELIGPGGSIESRGAHGSGTMEGNSWKEEYNLEFQRLDTIPANLTLKLNACLYSEKETTVPLKAGKIVTAANGLPIIISSLDENNGQGKAVISYPINSKNPHPFDIMYWQVLDDEGELHSINPVIGNRVTRTAVPVEVTGTKALQTFDNSSTHSDELEWELPAGRSAVALLSTGCWEYHENLDSIKIAIPDKQ